MSRTPGEGRATPGGSRESDAVGALSRAERLVVLAVAVGLFLGLVPPQRWHPLEIWAAIAWSYASIPVLVAALLARRHRLEPRGFLVETVGLVGVKFAITYGFMTLVWAAAGPGQAPLREPPPWERRSVAPAEPPPPVVAPDRAGALAGRVVTAGRALPGALVHVVSGLEERRPALPPPDAAPLGVELGPDGPRPAFAAVRRGRPLRLVSTDSRLHAYQGRDADGRVVFNFPVIAGGEPAARAIGSAAGRVEVSCTVHPDEPSGHLLVVGTSPVATSDAAGRFRLEGLPAGPVVVEAWRPDVGHGRAAAEVRAGDVVEVDVGIEVAMETPARTPSP